MSSILEQIDVCLASVRSEKMKTTRQLLTLLLLTLWAVASQAAIKTYPRLTTVTGVTYENVSVSRIEKDYIYVSHKSGGGRIGFEELPNNVLKDLGLPTREEMNRQKELEKKKTEEQQRLAEEQRQRAIEEQRRFDEEQKAKGMVKFQGKWMTPSEIKEIEAKQRDKEYIAKADEIVMSKARTKVPFKVVQALPDGALCHAAEWNSALRGYYYTGDFFFLLGATSKTLADDEEYTEDLYWAGTYTYTTVKGLEKTVKCYSYKRDLAQLAVRFKFGLFDKVEAGTTSPSPGVSASEPVLADVELKGFGSGFIITKDGFLLTNHHVVRKAKQVKVRTEKGILVARIVAQDPDNDIALLKIDGEFTPATFAPDKMARLGQTVFTVGFPMPELQGFAPKVTKGVISSLSGIQDDVRMYQIDAAVQPGNSGGPLADENGNIVGVVVARLNDAFVAQNTGSLPQNVNYSVKKSYTMAFIDNNQDASKQIQISTEPKKISFEEAVEKVRKATVLVMVY